MSISMRSGGWCRRLSEANPDMASRLAATATPSLPWSGPPAARAVRRARDGEHRADNVIIHEYGRIADAPSHTEASRPEWFAAFLADRRTRKPVGAHRKGLLPGPRRDRHPHRGGADTSDLSRMSLDHITTGSMRTAFAQSRGGLRGEHLARQPVDTRRLLAHARPWRSGPVRARHAARIGPLHFASSDIAGIGLMHVDGAIRSGRRAGRSSSIWSVRADRSRLLSRG